MGFDNEINILKINLDIIKIYCLCSLRSRENMMYLNR